MENENRRKEEKFREIERTKKNLQKSKILGNKIIPQFESLFEQKNDGPQIGM